MTEAVAETVKSKTDIQKLNSNNTDIDDLY